VFGSRQVRLLLLAVLIVTASTQPVFLLGASFFAIGPDMGFGPVGLGALTAAFFLTASATSPWLGRWVQRVGWPRAMRVNALMSAVLMAAIAAWATSVPVLVGLLVVAAAVYGMSNPAANQALAEHTDPARAATVFGIKHAGIPMSTLLAGLAVPLVVVRWGWRPADILGALVAAVTFLLIPSGEGARPGVPAVPGRGSPLGRRRLIALGVVAALGAVAATALGTYLVSAALDAGFAEDAAGWLQFGGSAASILARLAVGVVTDRRQAVGFGGLLALLGAGALVFAVLPLTAGAGFAVTVAAAYATGWAWPGLVTFTVVDANRGSAAASSAITQAGVFVGAEDVPVVVELR
jgi:MFS family permease